MLDSSTHEDEDMLMEERNQRLIEWNTATLVKILKQIIARRKSKRLFEPVEETLKSPQMLQPCEGAIFLDEVKEIIELPEFDAASFAATPDPESIQVDPEIESEVRDYVTCIAAMYRKNPFHNFEHASHVTMSVVVCTGGFGS